MARAMRAYEVLKFLHILFAILAVGTNFTYAAWIARARTDPTALRFALTGIRFLDGRMANPAYALLLVTGLAMIHVRGLPLTIPWLLTSLVLYAVVVGVGLAGYTPVLRKQIKVLETPGIDSEEYRHLAALGLRIGVLLVVLVVVIVFLMVTKPALWE